MKNKNFFRWFIIFSMIGLGLTNGATNLDQTLNIGLLIYVALVLILVFTKKNNPLKSKTILVFPICILFIISSFLNSVKLRQYLAHEPAPETYRTDMDDFLKTFYLMKKGGDYYTSFKVAVVQNAFKTKVSDNLWSWRLPTIFYIWKILPGTNGVAIFYLFIFLAGLSLFFSYLLTRSLLSATNAYLAILSPYLLYPYLHFAVRDTTILQTEWWGIFPFILGLFFIKKMKFNWGLLFLTLSVLIRELFIVPLLLISILALTKKEKKWWKYLLPIGALILILFAHTRYVATQIVSSRNLFTLRLHNISKQIFQVTLAFGSWEFWFYRLKPFYIFYILGLVGVLKNVKNNYLFLSFYLFPLSFLLIGSSSYNDYWGIFYMPMVLISQPLLLDL